MIVLASTSSTRQAMLRNAGIPFEAEAPRVNERELAANNPQWKPADTALGLARAKAQEVSLRKSEALVIGADQVLALDDRLYSKPSNRTECASQLSEFRGKTHRLISAVVCARDGEIQWTCVDAAALSVRNFSEDFLETYLNTLGSDVTTSVGGYKIEELGVQLFDSIEGDHFTILGLPLLPLLAYLRTSGYLKT